MCGLSYAHFEFQPSSSGSTVRNQFDAVSNVVSRLQTLSTQSRCSVLHLNLIRRNCDFSHDVQGPANLMLDSLGAILHPCRTGYRYSLCAHSGVRRLTSGASDPVRDFQAYPFQRPRRLNAPCHFLELSSVSAVPGVCPRRQSCGS